jgi:hypothetical protein
MFHIGEKESREGMDSKDIGISQQINYKIVYTSVQKEHTCEKRK